MKKLSLFLAVSVALPAPTNAQRPDSAPNVLVVTAHPDDHGAFPATIYKITHDLHGKVDLVVITNGEAGYKYSTLAESYYGLELTDPEIGRQYLPGIRKKEAMVGGAILGIRNYFFFDEPDKAFTLSADTVLRFHWNVPSATARLREIIGKGKYDYILCLLPTDGTHGAHKAATIVALQVLRDIPPASRPIILAGTDSTKGEPLGFSFKSLQGYPITSVRSAEARFYFDRTQKFGFRDALDYKIVANWMIAEHKSQGTMQLLMNAGDVESFWFFDLNDPARLPQAERLFQRLAVLHFPRKTY